MGDIQKLCLICKQYIPEKLFKNHFIQCRTGLITKNSPTNQTQVPKKSCGCKKK